MGINDNGKMSIEGMGELAQDPATTPGAPPAHPQSGSGERLAVLHVVDSLEYGGLERVVTDLAICQKARGHRVWVFSLVDTDGHRRTLEAAGIRVIQGGKQVGFDRMVLRRLRESIASLRADIVHTHNAVPNYHAAFALATLRRPLGAALRTHEAAFRPALLTTCHDMGYRLDNRKLRWLFRASLMRTALVAMVSRQVEARFIASGVVTRSKARVVLNGIPVERFTALADATPAMRRAARHELGLPDEPALETPVIGAIGRLVDLKNHRALIDAMPALLEHHARLHLVIIGAGPLRDALAAQVQALGLARRVHLAGERDDIASLSVALDIFALPSKTEGMSIALLEAFASGLAVVASAVGGNPDIVTDEETGLLYRPSGSNQAANPSANLPAIPAAVPDRELGGQPDPGLVRALGRVLANSELRHRLGTAARRWVLANGSIDAATAGYDLLYREAIKTRHSSAGRTTGAPLED